MTSPSGDHVLECLRRLAIAERVPEPSPQLLKRSMRILGSSIAASRPDIHTTLATIKGRLVRQSERGTTAALRFQELHQSLERRGEIRESTAILHLLGELGDLPTPGIDASTSSSYPVSAIRAPALNLSMLDNVGGNGDDGESEYKRSIVGRSGTVESSRSSSFHGGHQDQVPFLQRSAASSVMSDRSHDDLVGDARQLELEQLRRGAAVAQVTEQELLRDVLYVFQGIDGKYVSYSEEHDQYVLHPVLLEQPSQEDVQELENELFEWQLRHGSETSSSSPSSYSTVRAKARAKAGANAAVSAASFSPATRTLVLQLCEAGWYYRKIIKYIEQNSGRAMHNNTSRGVQQGRASSGTQAAATEMSSSGDSAASSATSEGGRHTVGGSNGLMVQAFCASLEEDLSDYYRLIAVLETQLQHDWATSTATAADRNTDPNGAPSFSSVLRAASASVIGNRAQKPHHAKHARLTLRRLLVWAMDPIERLRLMAILCDSVCDLRGGHLATCLNMHLAHGSPDVQAFVSRTLRRVCAPLVDMVHKWVHEGELVDPHDEFFVVERASIDSISSASSSFSSFTASALLYQQGFSSNASSTMASMLDAGYQAADPWTQHMLRKDMVPKFLPLELAQKVLVLGKSLHFMRRCCGDTEWVTGAIRASILKSKQLMQERQKLRERQEEQQQQQQQQQQSFSSSSSFAASSSSSKSASEFHAGNTQGVGGSSFGMMPVWLTKSRSVAQLWVDELRLLVDTVGNAAHARLLELMHGRYQLRTHLAALKKFLLLGQGDFVVCLMDALRSELDKAADEMYHHSLTGTLDGALRASNAQYEPQDVLDRIGVKLLKASPNDRGWQVFSLTYRVEAPLNAVIHPRALGVYRQVFHLLLRMKRGEFVLSNSWRQHMAAATLRLSRKLPGLSQHLHACNLARNRMWHFVQNLSNYMMFEVLEDAWSRLQGSLDSATDMDALISAHDAYLDGILAKALLTPELEAINEHLHAVYDTIFRFCEAQDTLFQDAFGELARLKQRELNIARRTAAGEWGAEGAGEFDDDEEEFEGDGSEEERRWGDDGGSGWGYGGSRRNIDSSPSKRLHGVSQRTLASLADLNAQYNSAFDILVSQLQDTSNHHGSEVLRFLMFRLDFNNYYAKKAAASSSASSSAADDRRELPAGEYGETEEFADQISFAHEPRID